MFDRTVIAGVGTHGSNGSQPHVVCLDVEVCENETTIEKSMSAHDRKGKSEEDGK